MCSARKYRKVKILRIHGDRYRQELEFCTGCRAQSPVRLDELKKGSWRAK